MANISKIQTPNGTIYDITANDTVARNALTDVINEEAKNICPTSSGSGTSYVDISLGQTLGTDVYEVYVGTLTSDDSDSSTCVIVGRNSSGTTITDKLQMSRGNAVHGTLTPSSSGMTTLRIYASDSSAHSSGDTFSFTNLMMCKKTKYDVTPTYVAYVPSNKQLSDTIGNINTVLESVL